jgi:hypothetical protein
MMDAEKLQLQLDDINWYIKFRSTAAFVARNEMFTKKCPCCVARIFSIYIQWSDAELNKAMNGVNKKLKDFQDNIGLDDLKGII